jgi:hypothetical protein
MPVSAVAATMESEPQDSTPDLAARARRFLLHFLEFQIPMTLGAFVCYALGRLVPASSSFASVYRPGTYLYAIGDGLSLSVPVVGWMIIRGHGSRHSLEMAVAMLAPVAAIMLLGHFAAHNYLLWLITGGYPAMCLGMLVDMLYRGDHFTGQASHTAAHAVSTEI